MLNRYGHRKSWVLGCLAVLIALSSVLAMTGPGYSLFIAAGLCFAIAVVSATQDLAIDAYRITVIEKHEEHLLGHAAAMATCGWWTGLSLPGTFAFILADYIGWHWVYFLLAFLLLVLLVLVSILVGEPTASEERRTTMVSLKRLLAINRAYVDAVGEFFQRNGVQLALGLLLFIFLFKIGEAFLGRMVVLFYLEIGFTNADIGIYTKALNLPITITFAILAGFLAGKFGSMKGLMIAGILMAATNLIFAALAVVGPDKSMLVFAQIADGITSSISTVAFVAFITHFTSHLHAATQYGALASLGNASRVTLAATSGMLVDWLAGDWVTFFVLTSAMVLPALTILWWISRYEPIEE